MQQVLPSVRPPQLAQLPSQHAAVTHCRAQAQSGPGKPPADEIAQEILTDLPRKKQRQPAMPQCQEPCFAHLDVVEMTYRYPSVSPRAAVPVRPKTPEQSCGIRSAAAGMVMRQQVAFLFPFSPVAARIKINMFKKKTLKKNFLSCS